MSDASEAQIMSCSMMAGWSVVKELGRGRYGIVYQIKRVNSSGIEEVAALKWIRLYPSSRELLEGERRIGVSGQPLLKERYRGYKEHCSHEIALMHQVRGESTIVSYDESDTFQHSDGIGWNILIRMECLTPLREHIRHNGLSLSNVIYIGRSIAEALSICHQKNIVHGDVKIENCFHFRDDVYKLGDFGLSISADEVGSITAGTSGYLAPECLNGGPKTAYSDQYALGILLATLLNDTNTPLFAEGNIVQPQRCPDDLWKIIVTATQSEPSQRFESVKALQQALEQIPMQSQRAVIWYPYSSKQGNSIVVDQNHAETESNLIQNRAKQAYEDDILAGLSRDIAMDSEEPPRSPDAPETLSEQLTSEWNRRKEREDKYRKKRIVVVCLSLVLVVLGVSLFLLMRRERQLRALEITSIDNRVVLSWDGGSAPFSVVIALNNNIVLTMNNVTDTSFTADLCPGEVYMIQVADAKGHFLLDQYWMPETEVDVEGLDVHSAYMYSYTIRDGETWDDARDRRAVDTILVRARDLLPKGKGFYYRIGYRYTATEDLPISCYLICGDTIQKCDGVLKVTPEGSKYFDITGVNELLKESENCDWLRLKIYTNQNQLIFQSSIPVQFEP